MASIDPSCSILCECAASQQRRQVAGVLASLSVGWLLYEHRSFVTGGIEPGRDNLCFARTAWERIGRWMEADRDRQEQQSCVAGFTELHWFGALVAGMG